MLFRSGPVGECVEPGDHVAMARAVLGIAALPPREKSLLGLRARERIVANFDLELARSRYARLYEDVLQKHRGTG